MNAINCSGLELVMNPIEKVMTKRSTEVKLVLAVAVLVILLAAIVTSIGSLWLIPLIVVVLWIAVQQGLRYRHHRWS
jgi:membrane protein YdbS with pleckstrin-like domain